MIKESPESMVVDIPLEVENFRTTVCWGPEHSPLTIEHDLRRSQILQTSDYIHRSRAVYLDINDKLVLVREDDLQTNTEHCVNLFSFSLTLCGQPIEWKEEGQCMSVIIKINLINTQYPKPQLLLPSHLSREFSILSPNFRLTESNEPVNTSIIKPIAQRVIKLVPDSVPATVYVNQGFIFELDGGSKLQDPNIKSRMFNLEPESSWVVNLSPNLEIVSRRKDIESALETRSTSKVKEVLFIRAINSGPAWINAHLLDINNPFQGLVGLKCRDSKFFSFTIIEFLLNRERFS